MADRFEDLRNYAAVVANGGVNAAAEALGIAKSAVSRRLAELEARLGVTLVDRSTRRFELTAVGRDYHRRATEILSALDALDNGVANASGDATTIRIAADEDLIAEVLAMPLAAILATMPGARLELHRLGSGDAGPRDVDLLITAGATPTGHHVTLLGDFRILLCAAPAYIEAHGAPASATDLEGHSGITIGRGDATWILDGPAHLPFHGSAVVPNAAAAAAMAVAGAGIAMLPDFVARRAIADGSLIVLLEQRAAVRTVSASHPSDSPPIVPLLVDRLAAALKLGSWAERLVSPCA